VRIDAHEGEAAGIIVGGLTPLSTADWPERLAAVVFCQGCAWNCPYCQNAGLRPFGLGERTWTEVLAWLETRRGLLDAVVFSGGEPLLQPGLPDAMRQVRELGFEAGLHTSGMAPQALARALPLCGWVGLDLKAPRRAYARITGVSGSADAAWESLALLRKSGVAFELRSTWHPALLSEEELLELAGEIAATGASLWALQAFQPEGCADAELAAHGRALVPEGLAARLREALGANRRLTLRR
jgi:pyruvate formate lyase activating enzyme